MESGEHNSLINPSGPKIANVMPRFGFGLHEDDLKHFKARLDTSGGRAWKHPCMAEVSAKQSQLWLARYKGEGKENYQPEGDEFESVKAAMASLKLGPYRVC